MDEKGLQQRERLKSIFKPFEGVRYIVLAEEQNRPPNEDRLRGIRR
ncbi:MAG: hypothetical protein QMD46_12765 [Methanomicrobiales archaeon]|nr:hypothetical protein [Methanomicrobiales archaeon]